MISQYPPNELYEARNTLDNEYKNEKVNIRTCLLNNSGCSNQSTKVNGSNEAINSHSIPKKNLKYISNNNRVLILKKDPKNPFKNTLEESNIKSTLTFPGFCSHHDRELFKLLENENISNYSNEMIFLISYKALAKNYSEIREIIERLEWDLNTWYSEKHKKYIFQLINFELAPFKLLGFERFNNFKQLRIILLMIWLRIKYKYFEKKEVSNNIKYFKKQLNINKCKIDDYNRLINLNSIFNLYYKVYKNINSIAFSLVFNYKIRSKKEVFIYLTALPTREGSDIIISCSESDYQIIKTDEELIKIFEGDNYAINKVLNLFKDKIAHNINGYEDDYANQFFLEWEHPLFSIEYYKPKID
jgi:hypothetical protein